MACLTDLIGIRSECTNTTPTVGLYIDDLVTVSEIEKFIDAPFETVKSLFDNRLAMATNEVRMDVYNAFTNQYVTRSIIDSKRIGQYDDRNAASNAIASTYKGIEVQIDNEKSAIKMVLASVTFYGNYTGTVNVKVFNTLTGEHLDTIAVSAVAGQHVTVNVSKEYSGNLEPLYLGFMYDSTGVSAYKGTVGLTGCTSCSASAYVSVNSWLQTRAIKVATASDVTQSNITGTADTGGLSIVYSVECDHLSWMCNQKSILARPIMYKTAELLMEYSLFQSSRFNDNATNFEKYQQRQLMYKEKYDEMMKNVVSNMVMPTDDVCLSCQKSARMMTSLP